jgi:isopenicillin N synthase-like dioxygenase
MDYHQHVTDLGRPIFEMLAIGLGLDPRALREFTDDPGARLRLLNYPPQPSKDKRQFGIGAHTDFGTLTILLQQPGAPGIQVFHHPSDSWVTLPAVEDVFVVNVGDMVQMWTDGQYASALHRVINNSDRHRYSVACFYNGDMEARNPFKPGVKGYRTMEEHIRSRYVEVVGAPTVMA